MNVALRVRARHTISESKISQFGIGTWVAGSSVLAILFFQEYPAQIFIVWIIAFLAFIIWLGYIVKSFFNLWFVVIKQSQLHTGIILLPTVSIQSIVLLIYSLFATEIPLLLYQALIVLGYLFYLIGLFILVRYALAIRWHRLILSWNSTNSILHGALSISGLASITTQALSDAFITWILATILLLLAEGISFIKSICRLKIRGFMQGIFVYNGSQWARIFTFGMYYAFNRSLLENHVYTNLFIKQIVHYGQYGVLAVLLFELVNYFYNQFDFQQIQKR